MGPATFRQPGVISLHVERISKALESVIVIVSIILTGIGCLLASAGIVMAVSHAVSAPPRYARPVRADAEFPVRSPEKGAERGVGLLCVGAALLLAAAYRVV
jgi:hypothetical protein